MRLTLSFILSFFFSSFIYAQNTGSTIFTYDDVHVIELEFYETNFWDTLQAHYDDMNGNWWQEGTGIKQYIPAVCKIDGNVVSDSVGVRQKGYYSNWGSPGVKKPLKIDFNEYISGTNYEGLKKLNLSNGFEDPSMLRDVVSYKIMRESGVVAPRTSYAEVYLNGTYWGLYVVVEQVDKRFLSGHYDDFQGNLFKSIDNTDLLWQGSSYTSYEDEFGLKTNETENDWSGFVNFVDVVNNTPSNQFKDSIEKYMNVDKYLQALAIDVLALNWDSYYDHGRNFYMYENPENGQFNWIPWDYNLAFSSSDVDVMLTDIQGSGTGPVQKPLNDNILANLEFKEAYFKKLCNTSEAAFSLNAQESFIDSIAQLIRSSLDLDPNKFHSIEEFDSNIEIDTQVEKETPWGTTEYDTIPGMKIFFDRRAADIRNELSGLGYTCEQFASKILDNSISAYPEVYPNPATTNIQIHLKTTDKDHTVEIYNIHGQQVYTQQIIAGLTYTSIDLNNLNAGIYFVHLFSIDYNSTTKLIKK